METLIELLSLPFIQGLLGGMLTLLLKMLFVDWFTKGYFARKRRELRSYEALYDSVSLCEMRYSILWKSEFLDFWKGEEWAKPKHRKKIEQLRTAIIEELIKIHHNYKWLDDKQLLSKLEKWEKEIQNRVENQSKWLDEKEVVSKLNEDEKKKYLRDRVEEHRDDDIDEYLYRGILDLLKKKLRAMARYDY
ncbi:MAG: hypothetical protein M1587_04410 [Thaumarchaeota archaeon]|nr:hypothetical protein [Nitrososphaerota archaeon]